MPGIPSRRVFAVVMDPRDAASDEELVRRFNQGDDRAFEVLVRRFERPLYNFILRSTRDPEQAAELLQEVFLRVVQRSGEFQGQSKVGTWLYTIARNLCIDTSRKMAFRRHRSLDAPVGSDEGAGAPLVDRIPSQGPASDRNVIAQDLALRIGAAVEALPDEQREVFLMREVQSMPFKDIANVLGVPENTVKSRMRYALERLQRALVEYEDYVRDLGGK
jgi:RNA polymerase sigma-70 factor (ECF subfamily)